jgi:predicted nucleic acid-binding protein
MVPALVITEVVHFLGTRLGVEPETGFLGDIAAGLLIVGPVRATDWLRMAELVWQYRDLPLGTVDASIVATAERLGVGPVAALDRRHLGVVRPSHVSAFQPLP